MIFGGAQERGKRAGTENIPGIVGAAAAFDDVCAHRLVLSAKARLGKITAREITEQLRQQVTVPQVAQL